METQFETLNYDLGNIIGGAVMVGLVCIGPSTCGQSGKRQPSRPK